MASRQGRTYFTRLQAGIGALFLAGYFLLISNAAGLVGTGGAAAFAAFAAIALWICLFAGATATADAISSEKRDGTLGLLFLTDLRGYDVLAGKLASHGLHLLYLLVATVPALVIPLLAGGVSARSAALTAIGLLNTVLFSCAVGLFISTCSRHARRARVAAFLTVLAFVVVPFLMAGWGGARGWSPTLVAAIAQLSPASGVGAVAGGGVGLGGSFWTSFLITHGYAWLFLGLAAWRLPHSWQERPVRAKRQRWRDWWRSVTIGSGTRGQKRREGLLGRGPFHYLVARHRLRHAGVWTVLAMVLAVFVVRPAHFGDSSAGNLIFALVLCHLLAKGALTSDAAAALIDHRKSGAFELLLSTPLSIREIIGGLWWGLRTKYAGPVAVVLLGHGWLAFRLMSDDSSFWDGEDRWLAAAVLGGATAMLLCDLIALGWTAMWLAMAAPNPNRATGDAVARILVLPWLMIGLGSAVVGILVLAGVVMPGQLEPWTYFWVWLVLGLVTDAFFGWRSRARLYGQFRLCAERQFLGTIPGPFDRVFRTLGQKWGRARAAARR